jgi:hypothetical protein
MFKGKGHSFFCGCDACKLKRRSSLLYTSCLIGFVIVIFYQSLLLIFVTSKINAVILFVELLCLAIGFIRVIF